MLKNVGQTDKIVRYIIGIVILIIGFYYKSWWGLLGLIPILTAMTGYCLPYKLFGINTCPNSTDKE